MYRSLYFLKKNVEELIEKYGENTYVASFLFTPEDVYEYDGDLNESFCLPDDQAQDVLHEVGNTDWIYEQISNIIRDEISLLKTKKTINQ